MDRKRITKRYLLVTTKGILPTHIVFQTNLPMEIIFKLHAMEDEFRWPAGMGASMIDLQDKKRCDIMQDQFVGYHTLEPKLIEDLLIL